MNCTGLKELKDNVFVNYTGLQTLELGNNSIVEIGRQALQGLENLSNLSFSGNPLNATMTVLRDSVIAAVSKYLPNLKKLSIGDIDLNLTNDTLQPLTGIHLDKLDLSKSRPCQFTLISFIDLNVAMLSLAGCSCKNFPTTAFVNCSVKTLKLYDNLLQELPEFTPDFKRQLEYLSVQNNAIHVLHPLRGFNSLRTLQLENNRLSKIKNDTFKWLPQLTEFNMDHNDIETIENYAFSSSSLKEIHLMDTPMRLKYQHVNLFREATALEKLILKGTTNMGTIRNHATFRDIFQNISTLEYLHLDHVTKLDYIPRQSFCGLTRLQTLLLDSNSLQYLHHEAFDELKSLQSLSLLNNEI
jgi:Leucine-rich repeat (LRR) protein